MAHNGQDQEVVIMLIVLVVLLFMVLARVSV